MTFFGIPCTMCHTAVTDATESLSTCNSRDTPMGEMTLLLVAAAIGPAVGFMVPAASPRVVMSPPLALSRAPPAYAAEAGAIDWKEVAKYPLATAGEFAVISTVLRGIDALPLTLPVFAIPPLFFFLSLRSRVFALLPASRPSRDEQEGAATPREVKRPSWTPPGIAFPFIWLTISMLRAASTALIYRSTGRTLATAYAARTTKENAG